MSLTRETPQLFQQIYTRLMTRKQSVMMTYHETRTKRPTTPTPTPTPTPTSTLSNASTLTSTSTTASTSTSTSTSTSKSKPPFIKPTSGIPVMNTIPSPTRQQHHTPIPLPRIMSLDVGDRYVGVAISDSAWQHATPLTTIHRRIVHADNASPSHFSSPTSPIRTLHDRSIHDIVTELTSLLIKHHIDVVCVGLPLSLSGQEDEQCYKTRAWIRQIQPKIKISPPPLFFLFDERRSTTNIDHTMRRAIPTWLDTSRHAQHQRRTVIDAMSAAHILQQALNTMKQAVEMEQILAKQPHINRTLQQQPANTKPG